MSRFRYGPRRPDHFVASYKPLSEQSRTARRISSLYESIQEVEVSMSKRVTATPGNAYPLSESRSVMNDDSASAIKTADVVKAHQETAQLQPNHESSSSFENLEPESLPPPSQADLLAHAREFLLSSSIRTQSVDSKRQFLAEKGLSSDYIDALLKDTEVSNTGS